MIWFFDATAGYSYQNGILSTLLLEIQMIQINRFEVGFPRTNVDYDRVNIGLLKNKFEFQ
jgi:hypothetical protein